MISRFNISALCILAALTAGRIRAEDAYEKHEGGYKYINPLLECLTNEDQFKMLAPFKAKVESFIRNELKGKALHVSVYFRDLNNGPWFGISEKEKFTPASLLKVPIMIAYFKRAESDPALLGRKIRFEGGLDLREKPIIPPSQTLRENTDYTVNELIRRMVIYSDNAALTLLVRNIRTQEVERVFKDFGMPVPSDEDENYMTVKDYASFFRILFNASYLNRPMSEKALRDLAQSEFKRGLVAGVPAGVTVAHKFGERMIEAPGTRTIQLHDCGIVYYPYHPYLVCVMTRGDNLDALVGVLRQVSQLVYTEVESQMKK